MVLQEILKHVRVDEPICIFWFRRDLRLEDNYGLYSALQSGLAVLPIFIFDPNILDELSNAQDKRVSFIYRAVERISSKLREFDSSLLAIHGAPLEVFEGLSLALPVKKVITNHDYEPYAVDRDKRVGEFLEKKSIRFETFKDHVIFEKSEIAKTDLQPYHVYTPYATTWKQKLSDARIQQFNSGKSEGNYLKTGYLPLPSLSSMKFEMMSVDNEVPHIDKELITGYDKTRNFPSFKTTMLGVHLRFGTISIRQIVNLAKELNESWLNELIWREFFVMILHHYPSVVTHSFKKKYDKIPWRNNFVEFGRWCRGETGYPIVDAGMRELNETGFMHNRVRMIVASFLTKDLLIDWRWGEAYFAEKLLDYELASNNGNWQWAAGSGCDAAPYFRIFNPTEQAKKFDPQQVYIERWLGPLKRCTISPIVEHDFARKRALEVFKKALSAN